MPTQYAMLYLAVEGLGITDNVSRDNITALFNNALSGIAIGPTPGWSCASYVGPFPKITQEAHTLALTKKVQASWLVQFVDRCWYQIEPLNRPYDPAAAMRDGVSAFMEMLVTSLRAHALPWFRNNFSSSVSPHDFETVTRAIPYAAAAMGTIAEWQDGRAQQSSTAEGVTVGGLITTPPDNPIGTNPPPGPSGLDSIGNLLKTVVIWGGIGAVLFYGVPIASRAIQDRQDREALRRLGR